MKNWKRIDLDTFVQTFFYAHNPTGGRGRCVGTVKVSEPGYGFSQAGIYALMDWQYSKSRDGFNGGDANMPYFLGDTIDDALRHLEGAGK
jgi:hypothetical protein